MVNDINFQKRLNMNYLLLLAKYDLKDEFGSFFSACVDDLTDLSFEPGSVEDLVQLKEIIEYKKNNSNKKGMIS